MINFFISYNQADKSWAEWIAWQLEEADYTTILQDWDFRPSENFILKINEAIQNSERTIAVLSPAYLKSIYALPEWAAAFAQDPTSTQGILLPVCVEEFDYQKGLLNQLIRIDLVGKDEEAAKEALLEGIKRGRAKPLTQPEFPAPPRSITAPPAFPGAGVKKISVPPLVKMFAVFFIIIAIVYAAWTRLFKQQPEPPVPCPKLAEGMAQYYEAEDAEFSGDASLDFGHPGYSGSGYVSGYGGRTETATTFLVNVPSAGQYRVGLCYGNGNLSARTLTIYVNDKQAKQTYLPNAARWNIWRMQTESLSLQSGPNRIKYQKNSNDNGQVNLDFIQIAGE
ncbi:MAG: TIR domain-containing protein [Acidobacteria bacterium]|nr:TIR domain-containing protein [Acidobacteriota bacterium]